MSRPDSALSVAFYLADLGWPKDQVGLALTAGTLAGVLSQAPGGALVDAIRWKRGLVAIGIGMICVSALTFALVPTLPLLFAAEILHGLAGGIVTPAIAAISLGLVGRRAMSSRTGRNYRFDAFGNALTAGLMGLAGQYLAKSAIFPWLGRGHPRIDCPVHDSLRTGLITPERAMPAAASRRRVSSAFSTSAKTEHCTFLPVAFLFQLADASMLPVVGQDLAQGRSESASLLMAGLIVRRRRQTSSGRPTRPRSPRCSKAAPGLRPFTENQDMIQTVVPECPDQALSYGFCQGDLGEIGRSRSPIARTRFVNDPGATQVVREGLRRRLAPTSDEIVMQIQLGGSRTDSAVQVLHAQPSSPSPNASAEPTGGSDR